MPSTIFALLVCSTVACQQAATEPPPTVTDEDGQAVSASTIAPIAPGTKIDVKALPERTHLVFRSWPKVNSGEVAKIRKTILDALQSFTTIVLVQVEPDPDRPGTFRRGPYTVGIGRPVENFDVVITKGTAADAGISLGILEGKVLAEREKELGTVLSPGSSPTMAMFDFPATYLRNNERVPIVLRYAALVDPQDGQVDTVYWVLDSTSDGFRFSGDSMRRLPPNHTMDWEMQIDASKMSFGIPRSDAFAVTKLPDGTDLPFPKELKEAAAARAYGSTASSRLEKALRAALK